MQKALEDEENYDNASLDVCLNAAMENVDRNAAGREATGYRSNTVAKVGPSTSAKTFERGGGDETSSEEGTTEKHDCNIRSRDDENTQEAEFPNDEAMVKGGFGSEIDGAETAPMFEGDADGTERVLGTESPDINGEGKMDVNKAGNLAGDTMQLEDDSNVQETEHQTPLFRRSEDGLNQSQLSCREEAVEATGDAEPGRLITTEDLLASEVAGSWACDTAPSVYGDNESPRDEERENHTSMDDSNTQVSESPITPSGAVATKMHSDHEIQALSNMIGIMAPDVKEQFGSFACNRSQEKKAMVSDSDTDDECIEASKSMGDADDGSDSDDETQANDQADKNKENEDEMDVDDDPTDEDSVG